MSGTDAAYGDRATALYAMSGTDAAYGDRVAELVECCALQETYGSDHSPLTPDEDLERSSLPARDVSSSIE
eukprot:650750-Rhodomonas_salina.1